MSEDIELEAGDILSDEVTPDNFSFFDMLEGITYPTEEVTVSLDEAAAFEVSKLQREFDASTDLTEESVAEFGARIDRLRKRLDDSRVTFYLRGIPDELAVTAKDSVDALFMDKKKQVKAADGTIRKYLPEDQGMNYARMLNATVFAMHIEKVLYHKNGFVQVAPEPDHIAAFFDRAPKAAQDKLARSITDLRVDSAKYEAGLDEGFFPKS